MSDHQEQIKNDAMSEKTFKVSNGHKIANAGGRFIIYDKHGGIYTHITTLLGDVIREYYEREWDKELGRVRWPQPQPKPRKRVTAADLKGLADWPQHMNQRIKGQ